VNYIGSKIRLSAFIKAEILKIVGGDISQKIFCDIFAGTAVVARAFKKDVKTVISNDIEYYSFVLNKNYIDNHKEIKDRADYIAELNALPLIDNGFIYKHYCKGSGSQRQYFSDNNGKKIDTIRTEIQKWKNSEKIDESLYYFLLASLLVSADKVANTASVYGAFLKYLKPPASKELVLTPADFQISDNEHQVFNEDSNDLIKKIKGDILYLDPPYNNRQYGANYHILNTIALYDDFIPKGKTGRRVYNRSAYSKKRKVHSSFEELIKNANFRYIFLSYNDDGLMSGDDVREIMSKYGDYKLVKKEYKRFISQNVDKSSTFEHLHILEKTDI
jgi:adenine-specific DNA-methyltransferase